MSTRTIVWFRGKDLRVSDHAPLRDAAAEGEVIPLFVIDSYVFAPARARELPHRMQFLLESLEALAKNLEHLGSRLVIAAGKSVDVVPRLARDWKADRVVAHRWCEPFARERDRRIAGETRLVLHEGEMLLPPETLRTRAGTPHAVFTHFARTFDEHRGALRDPLPAARKLPPVPSSIRSTAEIPALESLGITRNDRLQRGGEREARERLKRFTRDRAGAYATERDRMDRDGTSRLSADLHFGTLSIAQAWSAVAGARGRGATTFRNELLWREFAHSSLWDRPQLLERPFREAFADFPWENDARLWMAWVEGRTGYPVVDAAARQLLGEGFVHNRARMIAASFLTKHLLTDFRRGEAHYMKWLTDGDWANNDLGWQWSAGCGCDAQPYFRVFNPVLQGAKFDPDGAYVRRWVPELANVPVKWIHEPWRAPAEQRGGYPDPIVDHAGARRRFLALASQHLKRET